MIDHAQRVRRALLALIDGGAPFTADDLHERVPRSTRAWLDVRPAHLGGVIKHQHEAGVIEHVGWIDSTRRPGYSSRVWRPVNTGGG